MALLAFLETGLHGLQQLGGVLVAHGGEGDRAPRLGAGAVGIWFMGRILERVARRKAGHEDWDGTRMNDFGRQMDQWRDPGPWSFLDQSGPELRRQDWQSPGSLRQAYSTEVSTLKGLAAAAQVINQSGSRRALAL